MSEIILKLINAKEDLIFLSKSYMRGEIIVNISKVAKKLGIDRKIASKYLKGFVPKKNRKRKKYFDDFRETIKLVLNDEKREFDYIDHLYRYMKREHKIRCSRVTFNRYIQTNEELKLLFKKNHTSDFTVRFETERGQQVQFDLKEKVKLITTTNEAHMVYIPTLTFGWSRYNCRKIVLDTKTETLVAFLAETFEEIGGVPKEVVIHNLKAFVEKPRHNGQDAILNGYFEAFCKDYGIIVKPCMPRRPQTKGKTETQNKIVDQLKNYNGYYKNLDDIHNKLEIINEEDNESISQATKLPKQFLFNKEKDDLNPLPSKEIRIKYHLRLNEVQVSKESLISYKSNKYSVPKKYLGMTVGLIAIKDELHIYNNKKIITKHKITNNPLNIKAEHELFYDEKKTNTVDKNLTVRNELSRIKYD